MASSCVPLVLRSNYSFLTGASSIEDILRRAGQLGLHSLALTDVNNLYGVIPFYKRARELGIKPIVGVHVTTAVVVIIGPSSTERV